jgi:hypothetical protein
MSLSEIADVRLDPAAYTTLRAHFRGALLRAGEEGYDQARRVWNGAIDRSPALIARCTGAEFSGFWNCWQAPRFAALPVPCCMLDTR